MAFARLPGPALLALVSALLLFTGCRRTPAGQCPAICRPSHFWSGASVQPGKAPWNPVSIERPKRTKVEGPDQLGRLIDSSGGRYVQVPIHVLDLVSGRRHQLLVGITEVTNRQYGAFDPLHRSVDSDDFDDRLGNDPNAPVGSIRPEQAMSFARWLSRQDVAHVYRLPTEAEWERCCRASDSGAKWWGGKGTNVAEYANLRDEQAEVFVSAAGPDYEGADGFSGVAPVASFLPNPWGLYDMLGNVWEICAPQDAVGGKEAETWMRGGSYADRASIDPESRLLYVPAPPNVGFRLVAIPTGK